MEGHGNSKGSISDGIDVKDLLTLDAAVITGLLFFFALSSDLPERRFIAFLILIPLQVFSFGAIKIMLSALRGGDSLPRTHTLSMRYSLYGIIALFAVLFVIGFDVILIYPASKGFNSLVDSWFVFVGNTNATTFLCFINDFTGNLTLELSCPSEDLRGIMWNQIHHDPMDT
jgi:hypothetical protein